VGHDITELTTERYVRRVVRKDFHDVMGRWQAEYERLSGTDRKPDQIVRVGTGGFASEEWPRWDEQTRRRFLIDHGFRFGARRNDQRVAELEATAGDT
jgi:hypothetical protein